MKTAVIYARYSSASQTEQSIEGQLSVCNAYAKANDLVIVDTYIDRAMTGTNDNRAAFQKMLADSEHNAQWQIVLVYAIDRFGRNSIEVAINKQRLKTNGKVLISATQRTSENIDGTKNLDGILLENVYIGIAEYYSAELSQKIHRGLQESRSKGQYCGGHIPYGYYVKDKKIHIDEVKAETVRYIFEQYALGENVPQIVNHLNSLGITHSGNTFCKNTVYNILKNKRYLGILTIANTTYDNIFPQIVPADIFQTVRARIEANKSGKRGVQAVYLLRHKLVCGYCGMPVSADCGTSRHGYKVYYYKCIGRKKYRNGCNKDAIRKEVLEQLIIDSIITELSKPETMDTLINGIYEMQSVQLREQSTLKALEQEKRQVESSLNNVMRAIEQGIISLTTNKRLHELETKQQELEQQIAVEKCKSIVTLSKQDIRNYYTEALKLEPQMLINYLIKEIKLFNDRIEITYNSPLKICPDNARDFSFAEKTVQMPVMDINSYIKQYTDITLIMTVR